MNTPFNRHEYTQLSAFVRAYLHEDFKLEHGSPEGALDDFRKHATAKQWAELKSEFRKFLNAIEHVPFAQAQAWWTNELGSAWLPADKSLLIKLQHRSDPVDTK